MKIKLGKAVHFNVHFVCLLYITFVILRYNIEQEQKLALETTVLVEQYTVSLRDIFGHYFNLLSLVSKISNFFIEF